MEAQTETEETDQGEKRHPAASTDSYEPHILLVADLETVTVQLLRSHGFVVEEIVELRNLGMRIVRVRVESPQKEASVRKWLEENHLDTVDVNSYYGLDRGDSGSADEEGYPKRLMHWPSPCPSCGNGTRIGMVDTEVDGEAGVFESGRFTAKSFVARGKECPSDHGTSIASILAGGCDERLCGLLPHAKLYAAAAFSVDREGSCRATALSVAKALDWLVGNQVHVINLSFSGPDNRILRIAVERVLQRDIPVFASAGNYGNGSQPVYPAAYPGVVAVTAVDRFKNAYMWANTGGYIDFAAPGVWIPVVLGRGRHGLRSGTSYSSAFCAGLAALYHVPPGHRRKVIAQGLQKDALDLGKPGRDPVFGHGLAICGRKCRKWMK